METEATLSQHTDEALMALLAASRSHAAFAVLVQRHASRLRGVAFRYTGTREEAEDIVQSAFLRLWHKPQAWQPGRGVPFGGWFHRVVVNACLDHQRRHKPVPLLEGEDFPDPAPTSEEQLAARQQEQSVERAFRSLPAPMQASLNLGFYDALPHKEAAAAMGISVPAFQALLMRAKKALKQKLLPPDEQEKRRYG